MINITASRRNRHGPAELNMAPLIDMVFILLIFFLVTTSFVKETGIDVHRPTASTAVSKNKTTILIAIDPQKRKYHAHHIPIGSFHPALVACNIIITVKFPLNIKILPTRGAFFLASGYRVAQNTHRNRSGIASIAGKSGLGRFAFRMRMV